MDYPISTDDWMREQGYDPDDEEAALADIGWRLRYGRDWF